MPPLLDPCCIVLPKNAPRVLSLFFSVHSLSCVVNIIPMNFCVLASSESSGSNFSYWGIHRVDASLSAHYRYSLLVIALAVLLDSGNKTEPCVPVDQGLGASHQVSTCTATDQRWCTMR